MPATAGLPDSNSAWWTDRCTDGIDHYLGHEWQTGSDCGHRPGSGYGGSERNLEDAQPSSHAIGSDQRQKPGGIGCLSLPALRIPFAYPLRVQESSAITFFCSRRVVP